MENGIHEIEARYAALFNRSTYCVYLHDLEGWFIDANDAALKMLGYGRDEIRSLNLADLLSDDQIQDVFKSMEQHLKTGSSEVSVYRLRRKDGQYVYVETDTAILYRKGKEPYAIQGFAKDVTAQKRAEKALLESERKYRRLFNESGNAIFITSREGQCLDVNPALLTLFGYTRDELIGKINVLELYANPGDREAFQRQMDLKHFVKDYEITLQKKDGTKIQCLLTATAREGGDGGIPGYQGIIQDVSRQNRAEKALREREAHYRAIVEAFDGLIYICSRDYRVEFMNRRLMERTGRDATGELCYKALHGLDAVCPWCVNDRVFKGEIVRWELLSPKDHRWYYIVNTLIYHEDGTLSKQALFLDITDRKRMEEAVKESSEKMKLFAYSVSHDLKSPAISSHGLAKRLRGNYGDLLNERGKRYCDHIVTASEQMVTLLDEINVYISAKEAPLHIQRVEVKEVLQAIRREFSAPLDHRGITWREPGHTPPIHGDRMSLVRVLRNIVDNALKYGGDRLSEINIGYEKTDEHHILSIQNNGLGIGTEDAQKIFGLFMRRDGTEGVKGTGLGLAIVKEIAERHQGSVWVDSKAESGITFYVSFSKHLGENSKGSVQV
jgi:PAS domain S-box-containing protein